MHHRMAIGDMRRMFVQRLIMQIAHFVVGPIGMLFLVVGVDGIMGDGHLLDRHLLRCLVADPGIPVKRE